MKTLLLLSLFGSLLGSALSHEKCPDGKNWHDLKHTCWRESEHRMDFESALDFCIAKDYKDGPGANLIPVGKLRHLVNRFAHHQHEIHFGDDEGPFHVNAVKAEDGLWREHPSGRLINFHHFPHFDAARGHEGDTLHWDPIKNELKISEKNEEIKAICYRPKRDKDCRQTCPGYSHGEECYDAGDCHHGECVCDRTFSGSVCQFRDRDDAKLLVVGYSSKNPNAVSNVELVDLETRQSCYATPLPNIDGQYGTLQGSYLDDKAYVCSGVNPNCYAYEKHHHTWGWNTIGSLHATRNQGEALLIPSRESEPRFQYVRGLNYGWQHNWRLWYSGGLQNGNSLRSSEILKEDSDSWKVSVDMPFPQGINYHCKVQINQCETAIISGFSQQGSTVVVSNSIYIYNWNEKEWRRELDLPLNNMTDPACGKIKDPVTGRNWILIAGGFNPTPIVNTNHVFLWDPENNEVKVGPVIPFNNDGMHMIEYTETEVLVVSGFHGDQVILSFSFENGWKTWGSTRVVNTLSAAFLVPKHFGACL